MAEDNTKAILGFIAIAVLIASIWYFTQQPSTETSLVVTGRDKAGNVLFKAEIPVEQNMLQSVAGVSSDQIAECGKSIDCTFDYNSVGQK